MQWYSDPAFYIAAAGMITAGATLFQVIKSRLTVNQIYVNTNSRLDAMLAHIELLEQQQVTLKELAARHNAPAKD